MTELKDALVVERELRSHLLAMPRDERAKAFVQIYDDEIADRTEQINVGDAGERPAPADDGRQLRPRATGSIGAPAIEKTMRDGHLRPAERIRLFARHSQELRRASGPVGAREDLFEAWLRSSRWATAEGPVRGLFPSALATNCHMFTRWASQGFNVFTPTAALAAKLMLTDVPDGAKATFPFAAFAISIPDGIVPFFVPDGDGSRQQWADTLWVHTFAHAASTSAG